MDKVSELIKKVAKLGLAIDPVPDYPVQLNYGDGVFIAMYEPNMGSVIDCEGATAEEALNNLLQDERLLNATPG